MPICHDGLPKITLGPPMAAGGLTAVEKRSEIAGSVKESLALNYCLGFNCGIGPIWAMSAQPFPAS